MFRPGPDFRDEQQRAYRVVEFPEPVAQFRLEVLHLLGILRQGQPAVKINAQPRLPDVADGQTGLDFLNLACGPLGLFERAEAVGRGGADGLGALPNENKIQLYAGPHPRGLFLALEPGHALPEQLAIQFKPDPHNVSALFGPEQVARSPQFQIAHRDAETGPELVVLADGAQPLPGDVEQSRMTVQQQVGVGLVLEPADTPAELIELRQAETIRALNDERVAIRDVQARLDDRGADQHLIAACDEISHHAFQAGRAHLAMADADAQAGEQCAQSGSHEVDAPDAIVQIENLAAAPHLVLDGLSHQLLVVALDDGLDRQPVRRRGLDRAQVAGAREGEVEGARNRRGAHRQHVHMRAPALEDFLVPHAEALLLVHDDQTQVLEFHIGLHEAVRADDDVDLALG